MHRLDFRATNPQAFPVLNAKQIAVVAEFAERKTYASGDVLYRAGDKDFKFYVIERGAIDIVDRSSGVPRLLVTLEPGEFTGDLANLTGRPSNIDAIAAGTTDVYEILEADLRRIIGKRPDLSDLILLTFINRAQALTDAEDFMGVRVIGTRFSGDAFRIRDFLTKNHVLYTFLDVMTDDADVTSLLTTFRLNESAALAALIWGSNTLHQFDPQIPWNSAVITRAQDLARGDWSAGAAGEAVSRATAAIIAIIAATVAPGR